MADEKELQQEEGRIISLMEAAKMLDTSYTTAFRLAQDGELRAFRIKNAREVWASFDELPSERPPVPEIGTTATDADDGDHEVLADAEVVIVDEVAYKNLDVGKEYTLTGTLMDKETAKPVQSDGKDVTSTVAFKPETANGSVKVTFKFDGSALAGHEVVAFETLTCEGQEVAVHADIKDKDQTVKLVEVPEEPKTPAPESPKEPEPTTPTPSKGTTPKTGDSMHWLPFVCLAGVAACVSGIALLARRRERAEVFGSHARSADDTYWQDLYKED